MSWSTSGRESGFPDAATVPVVRLQGLLNDARKWTAIGFPIRLSDGEVAIVTAQHVLEDIETCEVAHIATSKFSDDLTIFVSVGSWVRHPSLDVAYTVVDGQFEQHYAVWHRDHWWADPTEDGSDGDPTICQIVSVPAAAAGPKAILESGAVGTVWNFEDFGDAEFLVDLQAQRGSSGSPMFVHLDGVWRFAGIVTAAADNANGYQESVVLRAGEVLKFLKP